MHYERTKEYVKGDYEILYGRQASYMVFAKGVVGQARIEIVSRYPRPVKCK